MSDFWPLASLPFRIVPNLAVKATEWVARLKSSRSREQQLHTEHIRSAFCATGLYSDELLWLLERLPAVRVAEQRLIRFASAKHLRAIQAPPSGIGLAPVLEALSQRRGLILGCTHIGSFHHALIQVSQLRADVLVVTGNQNHSPRMVERLRELSGIDMRIIAATTASALPIARHLRRGGVVATMLDVYVDTTLSLNASLFNRPAASVPSHKLMA